MIQLKQRFGTSDTIVIHHIDWLKQGLGAKIVKFNIGAGGEPPEVNWEDKSAAIALIKDDHAKALASLYVWGDVEHWDWSECFDSVVDYLAAKMIERCVGDKRASPRGIYSLNELARLMARMTLHFELYNLWPLYSVEGRLLFSGISISASTYSQIWGRYQLSMLDDLDDLVNMVNDDIGRYKRALNKD